MTEFTTKSSYKDNTMIADYKSCPRKYFIRHILGWTIDAGTKAPALVFGSAWHAGMDAMWALGNTESQPILVDAAMHNFKQQWEEDGYVFNLTLEDQASLGARTPGVAHEMYYNYATTRERMLKEAEVISIEQPIAMPFPNMSDMWYVGKLDKVVEYNGVHVLEHKSTTAYSIQNNFRPDYIESWNSASQVKGYQLIGLAYHQNLQDVWVDASLVHKKIHDAFKFIPVNHSWPLLQEWLRDTQRWLENIIQEEQEYQEEQSLEKGTFRRNEDSCFGKYSKCPFLEICGTCSDPSQLKEPPPGFKKEYWEPFETLKLDKLLNEENEDVT